MLRSQSGLGSSFSMALVTTKLEMPQNMEAFESAVVPTFGGLIDLE